VSSGKLCRVVLVRTDFSEKLSASFIRVTRLGELVAIFKCVRQVAEKQIMKHVVVFVSVNECVEQPPFVPLLKKCNPLMGTEA
jgi:hypothetical protein